MPKEWSDAKGREAYVCEFVRRMWTSGESETRDDRQRYELAFALFQGKQDWGDDREDQDWMSRPFLHEFSRIVRRLSWALSGLVFEKRDFFELEPQNSEDIGNSELARIFEKKVRYRFSVMNLESLFNEFTIAAGCAGIGVTKVWVDNEIVYRPEMVLEQIDKVEEKKSKRLSSDIANKDHIPSDSSNMESLIVEELNKLFQEEGDRRLARRKISPKKQLRMVIKAKVVDPRNWVIEPDLDRVQNRGYSIERIFKRAYQLESLFANGTLDKSRRKDLLSVGRHENLQTGAAGVSGYEIQKFGTRDQESSENEFAPTVELLEYYGPLLGKDGRVIEENMHFIVGNGTVLLRDGKNAYYSQEDPYVATVLSKSPFKAVGAGVADSGIDQQLLINDLFATFVDMFKLAVYQPMVIDDAALRDPDEIEQGFFPGQTIKTFGKKAGDVFSLVPYNVTPGQLIFTVLNQLRTSAGAGAGIDVTTANPSSRSRISAREIEANVDKSDESILSVGRELDTTFVEPLVRKVVEYELQYGLEIEALQESLDAGVITKDEFNLLKGITPLERYNQIAHHFKIKVRGFRERLERQMFLRNVSDFLSQMGALPPNATSSLQWNDIIKDVAEAYGFEANRWIAQNTPQDKAKEENRLLQAEQLISNGDQDMDQLELPIHAEAWMQAPSQALLQHIAGHIQRIQGRGEPLPELPPQILQALGIFPEQVQGNAGLLQ